MLALKYSLRVVGVEMSKHNAKVAAKRAKVALKTVSKQKKQMGLLWRRAYEMCRRHRMRRAFRAWRGPRDCDHCCPPPRRRRNEKKTKKSVTSWIKNEDSGGVRSVRISFLLHFNSDYSLVSLTKPVTLILVTFSSYPPLVILPLECYEIRISRFALEHSSNTGTRIHRTRYVS